MSHLDHTSTADPVTIEMNVPIEVEESFAATLTPGDTFLIGGEVVCYENIREMTVQT